jgi:hypothetical protein
MNRRLLAVLALAGLVTLSGCALITGGTLEFSAQPATVSGDAQSEAGYDLVGVNAQTVNRTVDVLGMERTVSATNHVATYERDLAVATSGAMGTVVVFSTPEMSVAGQSVNPVGSMSPRQLLTAVSTGQGGVSNVEERGNRTVSVLGEDATVTVFDATRSVAGQEVEVTVHLLRVDHGGDHVVGLAVHPSVIDAEQAGVDAMFEGIEHTASS